MKHLGYILPSLLSLTLSLSSFILFSDFFFLLLSLPVSLSPSFLPFSFFLLPSLHDHFFLPLLLILPFF